jgi:ADP-glucose pyrophosphorylase
VAASSRITRSVVLPGAVVGRNCRISDAIVENDCRVPDGTVIDASWRDAVGGSPDQPVMVTADDFAPELIYASA